MPRLAKCFAVALLVASVGCAGDSITGAGEPCLDFVIGCDGDLGFPPFDAYGSIQVTTSTTGPGRDADGYTVTVADVDGEGTRSQSISVNGTVTFPSVFVFGGAHTVELSAVGSNCPVSSENPQTIFVTANDTTQVIFNVECGYLAYVASAVGEVSVIETATNTVVATISVGGNTRGLAITPDGAFAYVTNRDASNVSVIETATNTVVAAIDVGGGSRYVAITPDGAFAYVAAGASLQGNQGLYSTVSVIATATNTVVATIADLNPRDIAITPDGAFVYVASEGSDQVMTGDNVVLVIETASNTVVETVSVIATGHVAITPDGAFAYVTTSSNTVSVIATASIARDGFPMLSVGKAPELSSSA